MADDVLPPDYYAHTAPVVTDWAHMVNFTPDSYFVPRSLAEVADILAMLASGALGQRSVRVLGGLHSCSTIVESEVVIDTTRLPLEFEAKPLPGGGGRVVASAFMHAHDILRRAAQLNLSLTALGGTDAQTLAGLIATNTAGATVHHSVYETLRWVEYLTVGADGKTIETRTIRADDPTFPAVAASLGALGFMTRVGFDLVAERYYTGRYTAVPLDSIVGHLPATCEAHDFWRFEWFPMTIGKDRCLMWTADPFTGPPDPNGDYPPDTSEAVLKKAMKLDETVFRNGPYTNEALKLIYRGIMDFYPDTSANGPMRTIIPVDRKATLLCAMAEWSFDPADLEKVMDVCRTYFDARKWPNLPIEIECTRTDNFWMSPWNWPGLPYIIKFNFQYLTVFLSDAEKAEIAPHLEGLWHALVAAGIRFKAHWGKINFLTPDFVAANYQPGPFLPLTHPLFMNDYLRRALPAA